MRACTLVQATSTPDPAPDTGKEEQATPGHLRRRWWVGRSGSMTKALYSQSCVSRQAFERFFVLETTCWNWILFK